ncbi:hypothetical protein [Amycolatopsis sp. BJA-103]|uniref:hypothetical protein n=1 Tax=Amycolatopsis sp. BJA-103 TaxID=1911175 RepID=UPI000C78665E|nr:hypothetical protein [Amycolatopsis sp. BJA-103]AUI56762.1 hypothetical protein BKN51_00075 [Amycolatopsis sp. BJA-103]AUI56824.1 hypothetical protein BKN51_00405 [Amycolatopsis sp. BJA-103]PNE13467.1 hypothetical protein B1H26_40275 [Amycolatopsis sp. BJA-103]
MTTAYVPTGTEYADLVEALAEIGGRLEPASDFDSRECGWNSLETCGRIEYRIHRAPAESSGYPSDEIEVGACCLIDAFRVAKSEQDPNSSADLLVERRANGW